MQIAFSLSKAADALVLLLADLQAFMSAGPETIHSVVQTLLAQARQDPAAAQASQSAAAAAAAAASASSASAASGQAGTGGPAAPCTGGMAGVAGVSPGAPLSSTAAKLVSYIPATDKHHLMPAGVVAARPGSVQVVGPGLYAIGSTGIYLGQLSAGAAPDVWQHVGALLSCGMQEHPSLAASNEPRWDPTQRTLAGKSPAVAVCNSAPSGVGMDDGRAVPGEWPVGQSRCRGSVKTPSGRSMRCQPRYFHLPIAHSKVDRSSLMDHMADALDFLSYHLHCGRSVLIHDVTGLDTCVCVAVAMLLACFSPGESDKGSSPRLLQPFMVHKAGYVATPVPVSKEEVRRRLAFVSSSYPQARPSRGMLKQVYNFLCA